MGNGLVKAAAGVGVALGIREAIARASEADLRGQVALVTGASTGLGLLMARELADQGCKLVICARSQDTLEQARADLEGRGAEVLAVPCDVADEEQVERMVAQAIGRFGRIDVLVCNAGVIQVGQFRSMELEDFRQAMDIMFFGTLHPILATVPHMRTQGSGRIALVTSIGGKVSVPYLLPYNASKFAAVGLGEGLRAELAQHGITVTTLVPGLMRTGSYLNAKFSGEPEGREAAYRMFSALSSLPLLTADAALSAKAYVRAIRRGDATFTFPPQYALLERIHGLAPATTMFAMNIANRLLPKTGDDTMTVRGEEVDEHLPDDGTWRAMTTLGRDAAADVQHKPGGGD